MERYQVTVHTGGEVRVLAAAAGENLLGVLRRGGAAPAAPCGGKGTCGKCRVRVMAQGGGALPVTAQDRARLTGEELAQGQRLACCAVVAQDLTVYLPEGGSAKILTEGVGPVTCDALTRRNFILPQACLEDPRGDDQRLADALGCARPNLTLDQLRGLPALCGEPAQALLAGERVLALGRRTPCLGVAVDIGTTTVVGYLMDLISGETLGVYSALNAQRSFGADVISRCQADQEQPGELTRAIRGQLAHMIEDFAARLGARAESIYRVALAGNTVMMHLLADLPVDRIARSPFTPVYTRALTLPAAQLGLAVNPLGEALLLPCVAGYVGADTVAAMVACGMDRAEELSLLLDIGTNGEIALGDRNGVQVCAAAAGPAFEGAHIRHGMGGVAGAISKVRLADGQLHVDTIGGAPAKGICGSGLVDAIAALRALGVIDEMGSLDFEGHESLCTEVDGREAVRLTGEIALTGRDIREVQLAKGAIAAGIHTLLRKRGAQVTDIQRVYLAGGFGNYIDADHACDIGLIPPALKGRIQPIGNAAGQGARMALCGREALERAAQAAARAAYVELSTEREFQDLFVEEMLFPEA